MTVDHFFFFFEADDLDKSYLVDEVLIAFIVSIEQYFACDAGDGSKHFIVISSLLGSELTFHIVVDGIKEDPIEDPDVVNYVE